MAMERFLAVHDLAGWHGKTGPRTLILGRHGCRVVYYPGTRTYLKYFVFTGRDAMRFCPRLPCDLLRLTMSPASPGSPQPGRATLEAASPIVCRMADDLVGLPSELKAAQTSPARPYWGQ